MTESERTELMQALRDALARLERLAPVHQESDAVPCPPWELYQREAKRAVEGVTPEDFKTRPLETTGPMRVSLEGLNAEHQPPIGTMAFLTKRVSDLTVRLEKLDQLVFKHEETIERESEYASAMARNISALTTRLEMDRHLIFSDALLTEPRNPLAKQIAHLAHRMIAIEDQLRASSGIASTMAVPGMGNVFRSCLAEREPATPAPSPAPAPQRAGDGFDEMLTAIAASGLAQD